jgi:hypothetical protein
MNRSVGGSTANSAQIVQTGDNGSDNQLWQRIDAESGYYTAL